MISSRISVTLFMMVIASSVAAGALAASLDAVSPFRLRIPMTTEKEPNSNVPVIDCLCVSEYNETYFRKIPKIPCATGDDLQDVIEYIVPMSKVFGKPEFESLQGAPKVYQVAPKVYSTSLRASMLKFLRFWKVNWAPDFVFVVRGTTIYFTQCVPEQPSGFLLPIYRREDVNKMPDITGFYSSRDRV